MPPVQDRRHRQPLRVVGLHLAVEERNRLELGFGGEDEVFGSTREEHSGGDDVAGDGGVHPTERVAVDGELHVDLRPSGKRPGVSGRRGAER